MTSKIESLIPYFPNFGSDNAQNEIPKFTEFLSNYKLSDEKLGEFFRFQINAAIYCLMNNRFLFVYNAGVGKSCVQICGMMMLMANSKFYDYTYISTIYALKESMKFQAVCKCTKKLLSGGVPNYKNFMSISKHLATSRMIRGKTYAEINKEFYNKIFFIDEISKIILSDSSAAKHEGEETSYRLDPMFKKLNNLVNQFKKGKLTLEELINHEELIDADNNYIQFWRLTHACKTTKFFGLTATPISNHPMELFILINLFLDIEKQYDLEKIASSMFKDIQKRLSIASGIISYLEPTSSTARAKYIGNTMGHIHSIEGLGDKTSTFKLYFSEMYSVQAETSFKLGINMKAQSSIYQIQCFTNMNGEYGKESYDGDAAKEEDSDEENSPKITEDNLDDPSIRMQCSSAFTEIMKKERSLFDNSKKSDGTYEGAGCSFIYCKMTSTVYEPLKAIAESLGFIVIDGKDLTITVNENEEFCSSDSITLSGLKSRKNINKPKIIFIGGNMKRLKAREKLVQYISSEENVRGLKIQVVFTSKVVEMGYNFGNMERIFCLTGQWSPAAHIQVLYRVLRSGGHDYWKKWMKQHRNSEENPIVDAYYYTPYCKIFYLKNEYKISKKFISDDDSEISFDNMKRILSNKVAYYVGSCKKGSFRKLKINGINVLGTELFNFCSEGECPYDFFNSNLPEDTMIKEIKINEEYDIIYCLYGIIYSINASKLSDFLDDYVLLRREETLNFKELSTPSIGTDLKLSKGYKAYTKKSDKMINYPCKFLIVSQAYSQYMTLERKSIISKKFMRPYKQVAFDCKAYKSRNTFPEEFDGTDICDFEKCDYKCYSDIKKPRTIDPILEDRVELSDNSNTIFSKEISTQCGNEILNILKMETRITFTEIYKRLSSKGFSRIIIFRSIGNILGSKILNGDSFGYQTFVCMNKNELFIRRDDLVLNEKRTHIGNIRTLTAIRSEQNFGLEDIKIDDKIFSKIITIQPQNGVNFTSQEESSIISSINTFKLSHSRSKYLEKACIFFLKDRNKAAKVIMTAFKIYILRIDRNGKTVYINTLPRVTLARSQKNTDSKLINPEKFRILREPFEEWKDASPVDIKEYKEEVLKKMKEIMQPKLRLKILSPFYIAVNSDGDKILVTTKNDKVKTTPLSNKKILSKIRNALQEFEEAAFLQWYDDNIKEKTIEINGTYDKKKGFLKTLKKFHKTDDKEKEIELFERIAKMAYLISEDDTFTINDGEIQNFEYRDITAEIMSPFYVLTNNGKDSFVRETKTKNGEAWVPRDLSCVDDNIASEMREKIKFIKNFVYLDYYKRGTSDSKGNKKRKKLSESIRKFLKDSGELKKLDRTKLFINICFLLGLQYIASYEISNSKNEK